MPEPSWQDFYDIGRAMLQTRRPRLRVEEGDVTDAILAGAASMAVAIVAYANALFRKCFLDGARGQDLTDLAHDRGVDRDQGDAAVAIVTLSRPTAGIGAFTYAQGSRVATVADTTGSFATYTLNEDAVFGALDLTVDVEVTCTEVGKIGNVAEGAISRFLDKPLDTSLSVTNVELASGGLEAESDEDLRDRVRNFFLTQARGTIEAIVFGAKSVEGVARVTVTVDGSGVVTVYVADEDGNSNTAMVDAVSAELEHWRAAGDVIYVTGGVIYNQTIVISMTVKVGYDVAANAGTIRQAIISRLLRLSPGQTLYRDMISSAVRAVDPDSIYEVEVITPAANVVPSVGESIRTTEGGISFS